MQKAISNLRLQMNQVDRSFLGSAFEDLTHFTGYSSEMIQFALNLMDLTPFDTLEKALTMKIPDDVRYRFVSMQSIAGIDGWIKYFPSKKVQFPYIFSRMRKDGFLPYKENYPKCVLGYAAGNVIGTSYLITLLAQLSTLVIPGGTQREGRIIPAVLVKNSREEPMFGPTLFSVLEELDPDLLNSVALMIWDYKDAELQKFILSNADLVLAAAADSSIDQIENVLNQVNPSARFHKHGHKVSFTTVGKACLSKRNLSSEEPRPELFRILTNLSAIDSIVWDQYGCLSSRIHFIELGDSHEYTPLEYGQAIVEELRSLSHRIPRGKIPLSRIHDRFEFFNAQTYSDKVKLCSAYEDDFIVVVDHRSWNEGQFKSIINNCIERTIVIRPVDSILDVPLKYLKWIDEKNLQTMYIAIDAKRENGWSEEFFQFVEAVGKLGVTSIRSVGQGPFPQLAYSWDGYLPQSLSISYPEGRFTTVEFEDNYSQILKISSLLANKI
jgi:hypothetical protein